MRFWSLGSGQAPPPPHHPDCEAFAKGVHLLGQPCFIGATAGLRHALEHGTVSAADLSALQALLPPDCVVQVLSPLEEAKFECLAMRQVCGQSEGAAWVCPAVGGHREHGKGWYSTWVICILTPCGPNA